MVILFCHDYKTFRSKTIYYTLSFAIIIIIILYISVYNALSHIKQRSYLNKNKLPVTQADTSILRLNFDNTWIRTMSPVSRNVSHTRMKSAVMVIYRHQQLTPSPWAERGRAGTKTQIFATFTDFFIRFCTFLNTAFGWYTFPALTLQNVSQSSKAHIRGRGISPQVLLSAGAMKWQNVFNIATII